MNAKELGDRAAFPLPVATDREGNLMVYQNPQWHGMTVREMFAGLSLVYAPGPTPDAAAAYALREADALLALLAKETE